MRVLLASGSPRRAELMGRLLPGVTIAVRPSTFEENLPHASFASPSAYVIATAREKAREVWSRKETTEELLISADTVVVRDGCILEKPQGQKAERDSKTDNDEYEERLSNMLLSHCVPLRCIDADAAMSMLRSLNGRSHEVITGVTLLLRSEHEVSSSSTDGASPSPLEITFSVSTAVTFASLSEDALRLYVASGEPFDKAGGYGYQSLAATFVTGIEGCYYNVVGFPLHEIAKQLEPHLEQLIRRVEAKQPQSQ